MTAIKPTISMDSPSLFKPVEAIICSNGLAVLYEFRKPRSSIRELERLSLICTKLTPRTILMFNLPLEPVSDDNICFGVDQL